MFTKSLIALVCFVGLVSNALAQDTIFKRCVTSKSEEEAAASEKDFQVKLAIKKAIEVKPADNNINVFWHVINDGDNLDDGNIPDNQIEDSITVLNQDYNTTGLQFVLANTTRTTNRNWFRYAGKNSDGNDTEQQWEMKSATRQGGATDLNIWSTGFTYIGAKGLLGYSTFPDQYEGAKNNDGVVIRYSTVPGGTEEPYNLGKTLTHEVGHWVGLYHTFQGGCSGKGDFVDDTPPEGVGSEGCPADRNTCDVIGPKGYDEPDPIHNYMDYSDDSCLSEITQGQVNRLLDQISVYRSGN